MVVTLRFNLSFPLLTAIWLLSASTLARAQEVSKEYQVKAAFICNFVQFVEWPADAVGAKENPLIIGVVGENPFGNVLAQITQGKLAQGHPLVVRYFQPADDLRAAHVLFVGNSVASQMREIIGKVSAAPVLTIGDDPDFTAAGGIIRFFIRDNKVRFEINVAAAQRAQLKISSKLLRLAQIYQR